MPGALALDSSIEDAALAAPLPVRALVQAAKADDAVASALLAKHNPVLEAALTERHAAGRDAGLFEGKIEGKIEALLAVLEARGLPPTPSESARIVAERDARVIERWLARAASCQTVAELLDR
jgi:hypothetical protein